MSNDEITRFTKDVNSNPELMEQVKKAGNDITKLVELANANGYQFSAEDVHAVTSKEDLTDDELDQVSGGEAVFGAFVVVRAALI